MTSNVFRHFKFPHIENIGCNLPTLTSHGLVILSSCLVYITYLLYTILIIGWSVWIDQCVATDILTNHWVRWLAFQITQHSSPDSTTHEDMICQWYIKVIHWHDTLIYELGQVRSDVFTKPLPSTSTTSTMNRPLFF